MQFRDYSFGCPEGRRSKSHLGNGGPLSDTELFETFSWDIWHFELPTFEKLFFNEYCWSHTLSFSIPPPHTPQVNNFSFLSATSRPNETNSSRSLPCCQHIVNSQPPLCLFLARLVLKSLFFFFPSHFNQWHWKIIARRTDYASQTRM